SDLDLRRLAVEREPHADPLCARTTVPVSGSRRDVARQRPQAAARVGPPARAEGDPPTPSGRSRVRDSTGMIGFGPDPSDIDVVDPAVRDRAAARFRDARIALPTFAELADPTSLPASVRARLTTVDPDAPDPLNLFRVHWFNGSDRRSIAEVPDHVVLPPEITGVEAKIVVALG